MNVEFTPTPFRTVHVSAVVPASDVTRVKRSIASQAGKRKLGKRVTLREHSFGGTVHLFAIYRK